MKKIVVTYFEPFGGRITNASKGVVSLLNGFEIRELPVSWNRVSECITDILSTDPDYLFLVGEAGSYKQITIERTAHNIADGKDNDGVIKSDEPITNGGVDLKTQFELSEMPYSISDNAGKYLCNYTYYQALLKTKETKALFIHLPYIEEAGQNSVICLKEDLLNIINILIK